MPTLPALQESPTAGLQAIAEEVIRRAKHNGFVKPKDVREELERAGESPALWKDVLALARSTLSFRGGRYYYSEPISERLREEKDHLASVAAATREVIHRLRDVASHRERRGEERIDIVQQVRVRTEDGRIFELLSRDFSTSGMRLLGARSLLGQKLEVRLPAGSAGEEWCFVLRVLWTCAVGDELFENGGAFIEARPD
jgi:hypothetical protein